MLQCCGDGSCLKRCDHEEHRYGYSKYSSYCPTNCCLPLKCAHDDCDKWSPEWYHNIYGTCCVNCALASHKEHCVYCQFKMTYSPHKIREKAWWKIKLVDKFLVLKPMTVSFDVKINILEKQDIQFVAVGIHWFNADFKRKYISLTKHKNNGSHSPNGSRFFFGF